VVIAGPGGIGKSRPVAHALQADERLRGLPEVVAVW
jgi:hypothetical protein